MDKTLRPTPMLSHLLAVLSALLLLSSVVAAATDAPVPASPDTPPPATPPTPPAESPPPAAKPAVPVVEMTAEEAHRQGASTYALILIGHPGDSSFAAEFATAARQVHSFLRERLAVPSDHIHLLASDLPAPSAPESPQPDTDANDVLRPHRPATREAIRAWVDGEKNRIPDDATVWIVVMGHSHIDGRGATFNLPGPDLPMTELALWLGELPGARQVVWLTQPLSGYAVEPLKRPGRIVIAATEADVELNGTMFHQALGASLAAAVSDIDHDADGRLSLLDLYVEINRELARRYAANMSLATEHAQLDDNADGVGTELQVDYLTPEFGGRRESEPPAPRIEGRDGHLAAKWQIPLRRPEPLPKPVPAAESEKNEPPPETE